MDPVTLEIVDSTDGKFLGQRLIFVGEPLTINGFVFQIWEIENVGDGRWLIHNANYAVECIAVTEA